MNFCSTWSFAQISDDFYYLDIWQCARYFVAALFKKLALITINEMWGLGLELPGLGLGFYDKVSVSVSSRNLSQVSVSEVTVSTTSLLSASAKHMRQRRKRKECIITEPFYIIKCAVIQRTFGHGPKSFIRPFLCCWNIATCLIKKNSAVIPYINVTSTNKPNYWRKSFFCPRISQKVQTLQNLLLLHKNAFLTITAWWLDQGPLHYAGQVGVC